MTRGAARTAIDETLGDDFPNIDVLTREQYKDEQERAIDQFLAVTVALLLLAELIAVLGIVNTLALSVFERTRELGLLRVVGTSRRQIRRMVRGESVIVALLGGLIGTVVGLVWGWVFTIVARVAGHHRGARPRWSARAVHRAVDGRRRLRRPLSGMARQQARCPRGDRHGVVTGTLTSPLKGD